MSSILEDFVLVLNKSWIPIHTCTVRDAFCYLCADKAKFVNTVDYSQCDLDKWFAIRPREGDRVVRTARLEILVPDVIILFRTKSMYRKSVMMFSRRHLLKRDRYVCQYCGKTPAPKDLTIDHVVPRKRGGKSSWNNCVASCTACNRRKDDKTPEEAGMRMLERPEMRIMYPNDPSMWTKPYEPAWSPIFRVSPGAMRASWESFLGKAGQ